MKKVSLILLVGLFTIVFWSCERNDFNPEPNAVVVGQMGECGWLVKYFEQVDGIEVSPENTYLTLNLRKAFRAKGTQLILEARIAEDPEKVECVENEQNYKQLLIENAVEYNDTKVFINNN